MILFTLNNKLQLSQGVFSLSLGSGNTFKFYILPIGSRDGPKTI